MEQTYTIPVTPVPRETIAELGLDVPGVALNGVLFSFAAGIEDILATYNIAALDDCGGHVNNAESYHYHGAAGCTHEIEQPDEHAALIGYAMDGYGIYSMTDEDGTEPADLELSVSGKAAMTLFTLDLAERYQTLFCVFATNLLFTQTIGITKRFIAKIESL